jgi:hypothetical protein
VTPPAEPTAAQVREWAACGIAAAASRFIPVPLVDDLVKVRAARLAVGRTLAAHGRTYPPTAVEPLYDPDGGRLSGLLASVPRRILLFPIRKYVKIFGAVKGVPTDVVEVILLGRAVHRSLTGGLLAGHDPDALRAEAVVVRAAFEHARDAVDLRLVAGAVGDALSLGRERGRELGRAAVDYARRVFGPDDDDPPDDGEVVGATAEPDQAVRAGAARAEEALRRPEVAVQLARFDARLDEYLSRPRHG